MSRLVTLDPDITLIKEPEGYQFGKQIRSDDNVTDAEVKLVSLAPVASASKTGILWILSQTKTCYIGGLVQKKKLQRQEADKFARTLGTG